jgi:urea transporter
MSAWWEKVLAKLPAGVRPAAAWLASAVLGLVLAVVLHYVLYRIGLPSRPFIYVAF